MIVKSIAEWSEQRSSMLVVVLCRLLRILDMNMSSMSGFSLGEVGQYVGNGVACIP